VTTVISESVLDLNIFYREDWSKETGTTWSETFTIEAYIRESDQYGVRNIETGVLIECDEYETAYLAKQFPADEYGDDFWIFADEVDMPTRRIAQKLKSISFDPPPGASVLNYTNEPVTMA
jgi:hypothetical protein